MFDRPSTRRNESTLTRPRSSSGRPKCSTAGLGRTPAVQTSVRVGIREPSESVTASGLGPLEGGRDPDIDAALGEKLRCVLPEPARDLGEDLRGGIHQNPVLASVSECRVVTQRVPNEVHQLGQRLDTRVAGSDEDERQLALDVGRIEDCRGGLESAEDVVPKPDCVREVVEAEAVVGEAGDREHA